jgi:hypothetical protein
MKITKVEGATHQIEAAIAALQRGDFDIAITLAGAAEGMIDRPEGIYLLQYMRDSPRVKGIKKSEWITALNHERDWLKHPTPDAPDTLELTEWEAAFMIARATSKLEQWTKPMDDFKVWYVKTFG